MKINSDNKTFLKILSALAAIVLWFAITYTEDPVITQYLPDIDVIFEGEDVLSANGLVVINKEALPSISVTVRGNRSGVISSLNNISAQIDVSGISEAGTNTVKVKYNYPSASVSLHKVKTYEMQVQTEKIVSREIPVTILQQNEDKNTDFVIKSTANDAFVSIRGAAGTVYSIATAKILVDVKDISKTSSQEYFYKFYDADDDIVSDSNIIYKNVQTITVQNEIYQKKNLPVKVVLPEEMQGDNVLAIKSQSVQSVITGLKENCEITELFAYWDEDKKSGDVYELTIDIPDGCYISEDRQKVTVSCELIPKTEKEFEVSVEVQNAPEGIKISPENIRVLLKGTEADLSNPSLKAKVDLENMDAGTKEFDVTVEAPQNIEVVGSYKVTATAH